MLMRSGVLGPKRIRRHLWRMCFGLFIATGSFFLGQQQVFPAVLRGSPLLIVLAILPLVFLISCFRCQELFLFLRPYAASRLHRPP